MSSPTIKDVAKLAGVSISTVSRVMNESKPVSPESRRKVEDAIKKLDFKRNELARSLVMKRSNVIGVVVKDIGIPYMAQIIRGVEEIGRMYRYDILLSSSYGDSEQEKNIVDFLFRKQAEAILLVTENVSAEVVVKLKENETPFIQLDKFYDGIINTVTIDYSEACLNMTEYLFELGHKKILFIKEFHNSRIGKEKYDGYNQAIKKAGLEDYSITVEGVDVNDGYDLGDEVLKMVKEHGITAVFASEDNLGIGLINYCYDKSIQVPTDLTVVGFGDSYLSSIYRPTLTTVQEPYYDIGAVAMRRLIKALKKEDRIEDTVYLPTQIMERASSAKPKVKRSRAKKPAPTEE
ncbi:MAG: LacI family DNA-binding transcriptional regulator [Tissierellia bacterium]|nr:LacI family DNA-binding transcriptional regulator [Tissierellia bacterium]